MSKVREAKLARVQAKIRRKTAMTKCFDHLSGDDGARDDAAIEHTAGYLGVVLKENERLRTALGKIVSHAEANGMHGWKITKLARDALE